MIKEGPFTRVSTIVSKTFESDYDSGNRYFKEWLTPLYCRFSYKLSIEHVTRIFGKRQVSRLSVEYSCSYKVRAELTHHD